jgi:hypothetical protein
VYASSGDLDVTDDGESSLYNGDENHKIWNGSHEQLNGLNGHSNGNDTYDMHYTNGSGMNGSSTLGRPSRQRQISAPIPVPPPPKEEIKKKKESKKSSSKSVGSQSLSGTLIRPRPIHPVGRGPPPHMMYGPPPPHMMGPGGPMGPPFMHHPHMGPPPPPHQQMNGRQFHTIGHRGSHHPPPPHQMMQMHMPMQMMLPPQYATLQSVKGKKKKGKDKMNGAIPVGMPIPPPMFYPPPPASYGADSPRGIAMSSRKLAQSTAALDDSGNSGAESPGGTGIYRRKGHLNERAFSYSIRQEHRSRSHGSLASLQFNPPDMKKEREIIQMVSGLEIDESTLRRSREMSAGSTGTFGKPRR